MNRKMAAEETILGKLRIKCKKCDGLMLKQRQDDKVYYFCGACQRAVWIDMPEYLG